MPRPLLIVGIDPGTTVGYAILNLEGKLIELGSSKNIGVNGLIKQVIDKGDVIIVGTDKKNIPSFIAIFASKLGARIIKPGYDILVKEKKKITHAYETKDYHQMDALGAALFAYKELKPLLYKIDVYTKKYKKEYIKNKIQKLVLTKGMSINSAVEEIEIPEEKIIIKKVIEEKKLEERDFLRLYSKLKTYEKDLELLKQQNMNLKKEIDDRNKMIKYLSKKIEQLRNEDIFQEQLDFKEKRIQVFDREIRIKDEEINLLQKEITKLIYFLSATKKNEILKKFDNLGYKEYERKNLLLNIQKNDILLVDDPNIFNEKTILLLKGKVKVIIYKKKVNNRVIKELPFIFVDSTKLRVEENKYFALVDKQELEKEKGKVDILSKVVEDYRKERESY